MATLMNVAIATARKLRIPVKERQIPNSINFDAITEVHEVTYLATGGFNSVWLIKLCHPLHIPPQSMEDINIDPQADTVREFVLRLPYKDALLPNQITNDVAFKQFIARKLPHIPVPRVYLYHATDEADSSFTVEEYIDCPPLSSTWMSLTQAQKQNMGQTLAQILVDLAEVQFDMIGGLDPITHSPAPTVEYCKISKGREQFHRNDCYPIGPYKSTKEYILGCYDREIYYYTHATEKEIGLYLFNSAILENFTEGLKQKRAALAATDIVDEPFVLVHGDFHGLNILARGDQVAAIIDFDLAGSYPLSEVLAGGPIAVLACAGDESYEEMRIWDEKIRGLVRHETEKRGWDRSEIDLLMRNNHNTVVEGSCGDASVFQLT
ncbi:kinase-like domain-containing protein [Nemania serpens]|nr:kinase-like domain-containing protein [Nemania serpens]